MAAIGMAVVTRMVGNEEGNGEGIREGEMITLFGGEREEPKAGKISWDLKKVMRHQHVATFSHSVTNFLSIANPQTHKVSDS
jgi:hypothetical protein